MAIEKNPMLAHPGHLLLDHLSKVGETASMFAKHFESESFGQLAGILHDLGKAEDAFQARIHGKKDAKKEPHAHHGAALALQKKLWPISFAINGHHAGLHDRSNLQQLSDKWGVKGWACAAKLKGEPGWNEDFFDDSPSTLPAWLEKLPFDEPIEREEKMRAVDFFTRMLFSSLIDADRIDTENANAAEGSQANVAKRQTWRYGPYGLAAEDAPKELLAQLEQAIETRKERAKDKNTSQAVMDARAQVLEACAEKADGDRGAYSLTVPTGGGKTLSSVSFALNHVAHHNAGLEPDDPSRLRRVIIVIPYLNIIQQTTKELRDVFQCTQDDPLVLEHHSQASDPEIKKSTAKNAKDEDGYDKERPLRQLAAENWDAPVIVTTSKQFFDSLFSRRPADARKLHNLCQSIIVFDEVQTLPPLLLQPILDGLKELINPDRPYGCSLLLCTATQPTLECSEDMEFGFENVTPVLPPDTTRQHFESLKRVEYHGLRKDSSPPTLSNGQLADAMVASPRKQALAILNTRKQARNLFNVLKERAASADELADLFHLSTWMYPAHRLEVLKEVTARLDKGRPCILVSTQCIEAGVDVDFPALWRAFGPYDSIAQAAGRCNRNGALAGLGQVTVFQPEDPTKPGGTYESAIQNAELLRKLGKADPDDPDSFATYFNLFYQTTVPDPGGCAIQKARERLHFEEVSNMFNFIDADSVPLLIESAVMEDGRSVEEWLNRTRPKGFFTTDEWRAIQPYVVSLSYPTSEKTRDFLNKTNSEHIFKGDDPIRGIRRMKCPQLYDHGPNGSGLDVEAEALSDLSNYSL